MPRKRHLRKVVAPPKFNTYTPDVGNTEKDFVELLYEEYEAIKLADYDMMNHFDASKLMGVSRATFARIYVSARRKIAKAFVEVSEIRAIYGNVWMDENWFECKECNIKFSIPANRNEKKCPLCAKNNINHLNKE